MQPISWLEYNARTDALILHRIDAEGRESICTQSLTAEQLAARATLRARCVPIFRFPSI